MLVSLLASKTRCTVAIGSVLAALIVCSPGLAPSSAAPSMESTSADGQARRLQARAGGGAEGGESSELASTAALQRAQLASRGSSSTTSDAPAGSSSILRFRAVRAFFDELHAMEVQSAAGGGGARGRRNGRRKGRASSSRRASAGAPVSPVDATARAGASNRTAEPGLVQTQKYSGRAQTGCVGGCF